MDSNTTKYAAVLLLLITPLAICSCSDKAPTTTADSAGLPAGWSGQYIKKGDAKPTPKVAPKPPGAASN